MTSQDMGHVVVLEPNGTLCEGPECDAMERTLLGLAERGVPVVVDLSKTHTLTAHGLGVLAHAQKIASDHGGRIAVCGMSHVQHWLFSETHLADVLALHATRADALRDLAAPPAAWPLPATWPQRAAS